MTILEKLTKEIYEECKKDGEPVTYAEAREMAEAEIKAKTVTNEKVQSADKTEKKERKPRKITVSDEKKAVFDAINQFLSENFNTSVEIENKKWKIAVNGKTFTLDLVENRPKKAEK